MLLELENLRVSYGKIAALHGIHAGSHSSELSAVNSRTQISLPMRSCFLDQKANPPSETLCMMTGQVHDGVSRLVVTSS